MSKIVTYSKKGIRYVLMLINLALMGLMVVCAFSGHISPTHFRYLALLQYFFPYLLLAVLAFTLFWLVFHWKNIWLNLLALLICAPSIRTLCPINLSKEAPEDAIKVLTYNTFNVPKEKGVDWKDHSIVRYIAESGADIVCCQECKHLEKKEIDAVLAEVYPYRNSQEAHRTTLACFSKYPILSAEVIDYESENNGSIAYRLLVGADTLLLINNHFEGSHLTKGERKDYEEIIRERDEQQAKAQARGFAGKLAQSAVARAPQADAVAAYISQAPERYVVLVGDFNEPVLGYVHHRLTDLLNDAYTRSGSGLGNSYHKHYMNFRIDNLLVSPNIEAYGAKVDKSIETSDHYPLSASISF